MYVQFDVIGLVFGDVEQFDLVVELFGVFDVGSFQFGDVFDVGFVELDWNVEGNGSNQCCFVGGIDFFDIKCWIGFGIVEVLGFF